MHKIQKKLLSLASLEDISKLTYREIASRIGCGYASQVKHHLEQLKKRGQIVQRADGSIVVLPSSAYAVTSLPILGEADCGEATSLATDQIQGYLSLSPSIMPKRLRNTPMYALKARGRSMNKASINGKSIDDGDYVIIEKLNPYVPLDGDYVVSIIEGLANIKKFSVDRNNHRIVLLPESHDDFPPIIIAEEDLHYYQIAGRVVDVVKGFRSSNSAALPPS
ncbi:MAG: S24 family peptidase [Patescibacteria group bacterium]